MADLHQFPDISRVLISEEQLQQTVQRIAQEINDTYADAKKPLLMVGILKGSVVFMADLMRYITVYRLYAGVLLWFQHGILRQCQSAAGSEVHQPASL